MGTFPNLTGLDCVLLIFQNEYINVKFVLQNFPCLSAYGGSIKRVCYHLALDKVLQIYAGLSCCCKKTKPPGVSSRLARATVAGDLAGAAGQGVCIARHGQFDPEVRHRHSTLLAQRTPACEVPLSAAAPCRAPGR